MRAFATACMPIAAQSDDPRNKLKMIAMARSWQLLAEQAEKNSHTDVVYETPARAPGSSRSRGPIERTRFRTIQV